MGSLSHASEGHYLARLVSEGRGMGGSRAQSMLRWGLKNFSEILIRALQRRWEEAWRLAFSFRVLTSTTFWLISEALPWSHTMPVAETFQPSALPN
jgi:hypothetical protein